LLNDHIFVCLNRFDGSDLQSTAGGIRFHVRVMRHRTVVLCLDRLNAFLIASIR
jgi:hypothetical protein